MGAVLAAFAEEVGAGEGKLVVLVLDNAGWHVSGDLVVPPGIELAFLPPYTPELQPAEHLWPLANQAVANKHFATLKDLDVALGERCRTLAAMPETIKAATRSAWLAGRYARHAALELIIRIASITHRRTALVER